ncbi:fumarate reductase subunit C [Roseospira visakhapatnamensis]|uniref:Fumarate reductase subunit C n=1 Tax=Roseospira visakhapatnamensis TaxID=390880 RepID=A0A7W6RB58_9PROT|nr:fumarate reductase subunit C [Roseospira visakhapatnamensis]MBB4265185.1 fumarate reductase subunit C [Roseospira visakhapatnamensis]
MSRKPFVRPVPATTWYMRNGRYLRYMAREVSSLFIGLYMAGLAMGLMRLAQGPDAWNAYLTALSSPLALVFHVLAFAFATYHATTWFNATPKAMRIRWGDGYVPGPTVVRAHYALWGLVSLVILVLVGVI